MSEQSLYFRPVVVIPVYNHPDTVRDVVSSILKFHLPIILVNDGSNEETRAACDLCRCDRVQVVHRKINGGKGAALMTGIQQASIADYTHFITIDPDGQMDPGTIPVLLKLARRNPDKVICGYSTKPTALAPKRRRFRRFSTFLANVNSLTLSIADVHCGYRLYPLAPVCQLLARIKPGRQMQFDAEILIRLLWLGVRVLNVPIELREPQDNISHFSHFPDYASILWMHLRLFLIMLTRLPLVVFARFTGWHNSPHTQLSTPTLRSKPSADNRTKAL